MYKELVVQVTEILYEDNQIQLLGTSEGANKAMLYRTMLPRVSTGDKVVVNATAVSLKLGTGGWDIVKSVGDSSVLFESEQPGHIMKARYTPSQHSVLAVEAQESEYHSLFTKEFQLKTNDNILIAELHSMLPIIYSICKQWEREITLTVIISDEAALPLTISEHIREIKKDRNVSTITIGQAFGGDYEAVTLHTALQFAKEVLASDVIVVTLGPGVVGTGSTYGFSGMALAEWANSIGGLGGCPVWIPRISFAEKRDRHYGLSHHILTPLSQFTFVKSVLPLPLLHREWNEVIDNQIKKLKHTQVEIYQDRTLNENIERLLVDGMKQYPMPIKTMGRDYDDDPAFFCAVATAVYWVLQRLGE
ncbi:DUF3866 family protein [Bacillus alkalicellulosilyticus]|uniref:DUF3866 family protein n=1 Tax=Alkalihalobacterium alkalicellulosilyticum TaxID=1912214 RepID=UPI00099868A0|nr:DUF3866 family protein [Bacillus alkalicellulosilyticus]